MNRTDLNMTIEHCDVLVIGAGPAGMAAALAAASGGASVVVVDDNPDPGGQIWREGPGVKLPARAQQLRQQVAQSPRIRISCGTRVIAAPAAHELLLEDAQRGWRICWQKLVLCTGARELLLPFPGWTLPGVTGAGALQALIKSGMPVGGERIVVAGSGPLLLAAAATATRAGAHVVRVAEQASFADVAAFALQLFRWPGKAAQALTLFNACFRTGSHVLSVQGQNQVMSVRIKHSSGEVEHIGCDRVACGFGLAPNVGLAQLLGCELVMRHGTAAIAVDGLQATSVHAIYAAGECTGVGGSERALAQGAIAGHTAVGQTEQASASRPALVRWEAFAEAVQLRFSLGARLRQLPEPDTLVCRCEDVPHRLLASHASWTEAKLNTRCGMGACQGRVCGAASQFLFGWTPPASRPPLSPARLSTLAASKPHTNPEHLHEKNPGH